jgi:hypothetical protein
MRNRELGHRSNFVRRLAAIEGRQVGRGTACAPTGGVREFVARLSDGKLDFLGEGMSKADPAVWVDLDLGESARSARSSPRPWSPASGTRASSAAAGTSRPGSVWCRGSTRAAAAEALGDRGWRQPLLAEAAYPGRAIRAASPGRQGRQAEPTARGGARAARAQPRRGRAGQQDRADRPSRVCRRALLRRRIGHLLRPMGADGAWRGLPSDVTMASAEG